MLPFRKLVAIAVRASLFALALSSPRALIAQRSGPTTGEVAEVDSLPDMAIHAAGLTGCLASLAPMSMHRRPVFLAATMPPHTDSLYTLQADLMAQDIADEIRTELGAHSQDAPVADGKLSWYTVPTQMVVTAMRNGDMHWRARGRLADSSATSLLTHSFDAVRARGGAIMMWPERGGADSLLIRLTLVAQPPDESDQLYPHAFARMKFTAFFLSVPDETHPQVAANQPPPRYPSYNESHRIEGTLLMYGVVDTAGRVIPSTIHDIWPSETPRLGGELGHYYDAFVSSVTQWEPTLKFVPARLGVCPINAAFLLPLRFVAPNHGPGPQ